MNDRIKELIDECWVTREHCTTWFDHEKFAELIVRECVAICETKRAEYTKLCKDADNFTDKNLWAEGEISAHRIRISIQEHFGVEE